MAAKAKRPATPSYDQPPIEALTTPFEPQTDQDRHGDALKPNALRQVHINPLRQLPRGLQRAGKHI